MHWTQGAVSLSALGFIVVGVLVCFLLAYAIAGRKSIRDWNKVGFWFLLFSFAVLPALVHGLGPLGIYPR